MAALDEIMASMKSDKEPPTRSVMTSVSAKRDEPQRTEPQRSVTSAARADDAPTRQPADFISTAEKLSGKRVGEDTDAIRSYLKAGGHNLSTIDSHELLADPVKNDQWCSAFVGSTLEQNGAKSLKSNIATDYANWGRPADGGARRGDVAVIMRGRQPGELGGHIGFATGKTRNGQVEILSGNSGGAVKSDWYPASAVTLRRASESGQPTMPAGPSAEPTPSGSDMDRAKAAIAKIESGGSYSVLGQRQKSGDYAIGKYQVMASNVGPWSEKWLGKRLTPDEFRNSPDAQEKVFEGEFGSHMKQSGPENAASIWFTGKPIGAQSSAAKDSLGTSGSKYVSMFNSTFNSGGAGASTSGKAGSVAPGPDLSGGGAPISASRNRLGGLSDWSSDTKNRLTGISGADNIMSALLSESGSASGSGSAASAGGTDSAPSSPDAEISALAPAASPPRAAGEVLPSQGENRAQIAAATDMPAPRRIEFGRSLPKLQPIARPSPKGATAIMAALFPQQEAV